MGAGRSGCGALEHKAFPPLPATNSPCMPILRRSGSQGYERKTNGADTWASFSAKRAIALRRVGGVSGLGGCCGLRPFPTPKISDEPLAGADSVLKPVVVKAAGAPKFCVDVHAHFSNASDVPVKGFLEGPVAHDMKEPLRSLVKALAPFAGQRAPIAPTAANEYRELLEVAERPSGWMNLQEYSQAYSSSSDAFGLDHASGALVDFDRWLDCPPLSSHETKSSFMRSSARSSAGTCDPSWPSGGPPAKKRACKSLTYKPFGFWWRFRDSNPGPADYDSVALTD